MSAKPKPAEPDRPSAEALDWKALRVQTRPRDIANPLKTDEDIAGYLDQIARLCDASILVKALSDAARAKGMTKVAKAAGPGRGSLYKALSADAHPRHETIFAVLRALGLRLAVVPITDEDRQF